jgi:hypothetical protein
MSSAFPFQNPKNQAPENILSELRTIAVQHYGFDGKIHEGEIILHVELKDHIRELFEYSLRLKFPIHSVIPIHKPPFCFNDQMSCEANNSSGFNYRTIHNTKTLSKHSHGRAFDLNPCQNIYITYDLNGTETYRLPKTGIYEAHKPGTLIKNHPLVIFMKKRGWTWGGDWTKESGRIDYQHFEKI